MGGWIATNFNLILIVWVGLAFIYGLYELIEKWEYSKDKSGMVINLIFTTIGNAVIATIILVVIIVALDSFASGENFCWHPLCN